MAFAPDRTQNRYSGQRFLGADHIHPLGAGELAGLRKILFIGELIAFAEERLQILLGQVHVTGGGLDQNFVIH